MSVDGVNICKERVQPSYIYYQQQMRKVKKFLRFENIQLVASEEHPRDVSRAHMCIIDPGNGNAVYNTFRYGIVEPTKISWDCSVELPYISQESLRFQTICEHEFGYEIEELKALYNGLVYIKPDQFFFECSTHCFNQEGRQCGVLKYMIKVIEREQATKQQKIEVKQPVKVDLIAKISIYAASLVVNSYYTQLFHKKRHHKLKLQLQYNRVVYDGSAKFEGSEYKWSFNSKFQVYEKDPEQIEITVSEDDKPYLKGVLPMATLQENKRFTVQIVDLIDQNEQQIASLHIDLRFVSKRELLDLMYSPKQLSDNKKDRPQDKHFQSRKRTASAVGQLPSHKKLTGLLHSRAISKQLQGRKLSPSLRYKISLFTDKHQSSIPRSRRFADLKAANEHISYLDPTLLSDFSPRGRQARGATQSSTPKTDFTKLLRANPGVGEYHLPSIWQKK